MKLVIIDYGMGNLRSLKSTFEFLGVNDVISSNDFDDINDAKMLVLPGVGSFVSAMKKIKFLRLDKILYDQVIVKKKPIFGICLGMQLLCNNSEEDGGSEGLGFIDAQCKKFPLSNVKLPHVGFNQVKINFNSKIFKGFKDESDFYFTHNFRLQSDKYINQSVCNYGEDFIASFEENNIIGTQFHPELSQSNGLKLLKNFLERF